MLIDVFLKIHRDFFTNQLTTKMAIEIQKAIDAEILHDLHAHLS